MICFWGNGKMDKNEDNLMIIVSSEIVVDGISEEKVADFSQQTG